MPENLPVKKRSGPEKARPPLKVDLLPPDPASPPVDVQRLTRLLIDILRQSEEQR